MPITSDSILNEERPHALRGRDLRRALYLTTLAWIFGSVWVTGTSGAPLTLFAKGLGASNFQIGLLAALPFIASLVALPASVLIDRTGARKIIFLVGLFFQRVMWFPIALLPLWVLETRGPALATVLFLALVLLMHSGQALGGTAWVSWMADVVPERSRGKYFSRRRQWGFISAIPTALLVGYVLDHWAGVTPGGETRFISTRTMSWVAGIFMVAAVFGIIDIACFFWVMPVRAARRAHEPLLRTLVRPLHDRQFMWFNGFVGTMIFAVGPIGQFVTLYMLEKVRVSNLQTQLILLAAPSVAQILVLPLWGRVLDRFGRKPVLVIASLGLVPVGLGWCLMNSGATWLGYGLAAIGAALWQGVDFCNSNFMFELTGLADADDEGGSGYYAVNTVTTSVAGLVGGLTWGLIAQKLRNWSWDPHVPGLAPFSFYEVLFLLSGLMRLFAVVAFLPHIHDPKARPTHEALRFMSVNIYNNLFNALLQPIRLLRGSTKRQASSDRQISARNGQIPKRDH